MIYSTLCSVLDYILKELPILGGKTPSTSIKLDRFLRFVKDKPFIVIPDEIDLPSPKKRNNNIYSLSRTGNVGIICISRTDDTFHHLDGRVKSRLSSRALEFEEYTFDQLMAIFRERATKALKISSWHEGI